MGQITWARGNGFGGAIDNYTFVCALRYNGKLAILMIRGPN